MSEGLHIALPADMLEQIVEQVTERVRAGLEHENPWLDRKGAAAYLGVPGSRLEKDRTIPSHRWDGRVLYDRRELDDWMRSQ